MLRGYVPLLLLLSALWGSSYLFIKVAVEDVEPAALVGLRLLLAAGMLLVVLAAHLGPRGAAAALRASARHCAVLGIINVAAPFWLISWGEKYIDSGIAAIGNATVPLFVTLLAIRLRPSERATGLRLVGILVGLVGVGVLVGVHPEGGTWAVLGTLAVIGSSMFYARSNLYYQEHHAHASPIVIVTGAVTVGAIAMLPFGLAQLPAETPGWKAFGSIGALALGSTVAGYLVHFRLVRGYGSARASFVTYLGPVFALVYGTLILDEPLRLTAILGLLLILGGVGLGSGLVRFSRRAEARLSP